VVFAYMWIGVHVMIARAAWSMERRLRRMEADLRTIEDDVVLSRWGRVSQSHTYTTLQRPSDKGLTPAEIADLPTWTYTAGVAIREEECSICLTSLCPGESIRQLGTCGHAFHRECIDLWLLRRADCPLCKTEVCSNQRQPCGSALV
jgi:hypothetical protein